MPGSCTLLCSPASTADKIEAHDMSNPHSTDLPRERPLFGIGAVAQITGIPEGTLRVWERRYHFPQTARTRGRHRLYSQDMVLQLLWVKMRLDQGMRAGQAIHASQQTERATAVATALHQPLPPSEMPDPQLVDTRAMLLDALLAYEGDRATAILDEAIARHAFAAVVLDVVGPVMAAIGESWCHGNLEVATEHFATNVLRQQLLNWMQASPAPYDVRPVVLACAPEELHEGSLLMLAVLLRLARWPVVYLGQALPLMDLGALVDRIHPSLIVFVAMSEASALALAEWPRWLEARGEAQDAQPPITLPIIGYGGRAFIEKPDLARHVPGTLLGATIAEGYQRIHRVLLNLTALRQENGERTAGSG